jgi:predicted TIM-barrel fold metal-dependent hydrolase
VHRPEHRPAPEEAGDRRIRLGEEDVDAAGARKGGRQLRARERAEEAQDAGEWDFNEMRMGYRFDGQTLTQAPVDYYRMFYCDTAIQGNTPALMCAYEFFGADHMVFATDTPYDNQLGERVVRETIDAVLAMPIDEISRRKIFADNARRLFRLPV